MEKTIKVSGEVYERLNVLVGVLREREKRPVSMSAALAKLLPKGTNVKPSDFAGTWKMSELEANELINDTRKLWKSWKR